uniref:Uncharacterized protein n=1 Tax=Anguilla anguilla TaxID=7936 RepID=A0A0E9T502_ANGAN
MFSKVAIPSPCSGVSFWGTQFLSQPPPHSRSCRLHPKHHYLDAGPGFFSTQLYAHSK